MELHKYRPQHFDVILNPFCAGSYLNNPIAYNSTPIHV